MTCVHLLSFNKLVHDSKGTACAHSLLQSPPMLLAVHAIAVRCRMSASLYRLAGQQLQQLSRYGSRLRQVPKAIAEPRLQSTSTSPATPSTAAKVNEPIAYSKLTVGAPMCFMCVVASSIVVACMVIANALHAEQTCGARIAAEGNNACSTEPCFVGDRPLHPKVVDLCI